MNKIIIISFFCVCFWFQEAVWQIKQNLPYRQTIQHKRLAVEVWRISPDGKTEQELAENFVTALSDFIKEIGLPTTLSEMGIIDTDLEAIAKSTIFTGGCCKKLTADEIEEILKECI